MNKDNLLQLLPGVYQRTWREHGLLDAALEAMATLHEPAEDALAGLDTALDPRRADDEMVVFLARWLDLDRLLDEAGADRGSSARHRPASATAPVSSSPLRAGALGRLRELVASAAELSRWRGTARGLTRFLQTATGLEGFVIDEAVPGPDHRPRPFHLAVTAPAAARPQQALVRRVIESQKPAYVTYELVFADAGGPPDP